MASRWRAARSSGVSAGVTRARGKRRHEGAAAETSYTLGVLALTNHGRLERLTVDGVPVGRALAAEGWPGDGAGEHPDRQPTGAGDRADRQPTGAGDRADGRPTDRPHERGSCVVVVATDAPLSSAQLGRVARRAGLGLARAGSTAGHGSGEIFVAFSTGARLRRGAGLIRTQRIVDDAWLDDLFAAVVEATEEAVLDSLFRADTVTGRDGHVAPGLPVPETLALLDAAGRLA